MNSRVARSVYTCVLAVLTAASSVTPVAAAESTIKVAYWNVRSGKGVSALPGHDAPFIDTTNCTDPSQPMNAWGSGAMKAELTKALSDPSVVALGLGESWSSICASPARVREALGWKTNTSEMNGVGLVARYGIAGDVTWKQLDTSLNKTPSDTMWVLRAAVCLDAACTQTMPVYVGHWYSSGTNSATSYANQAKQTVAFINQTSGGVPHVFVGDLNTFEGTASVCGQTPNNTTLTYLRSAGYSDAWVATNGVTEGYTGMANRAGCGYPEGYTWKRIDYAWTPPNVSAVAMQRFGMRPAGDASPSDHYGIVVTLPNPGGPVEESPLPDPEPDPGLPDDPREPGDTEPAAGDIVLYAKNAVKISGAWTPIADATAAGGVRLANRDAGAAKLASPSASPASYFELPFTAEPGRAYRLWIRGKAENDSWQNDSTFAQFSGSLANGAPAFRIGTTSATVVSIEEGSGIGVAGWGWQDNGYGMNVLGPAISFDAAAQTLRIQVREDGLSIDQIVLSPVTYASAAPGAGKNDTTILPATAAGAREIVLYAKHATKMTGAWSLVADTTAAGGQRLANADAGAAKLASASASPASYFEIPFTPEKGRKYRLWIRGKAQNDAWQNDSTFVQFSGSVAADGTPTYRIGTSSAAVVSIEEGSGAGVSGWGWQDNGYGFDVMGPEIYFDGTPQTLRVQVREDGLSIDQIVLSSEKYLAASPGAEKNDTTILAATSLESAPSTPTTTQPSEPTAAGNGDIVLHASQATTIAGAWTLVADATAADGARLANPDAGAPKLAAAYASPASYFEIPFTAEPGRAYRLWVRGKAQNDAWQNDSTFVQFSGSVALNGSPMYRIGTTAATVVSIEEGSGAGVSGWGWQDNGYGFNELGDPIMFNGSAQTLRVQVREDGPSIDQIVLSPVQYFTSAPGAGKNDTTILASQGATGATTTSAGTATTTSPTTTTAPATTTTSAPLRLLQWNIHHGGFGTDGVYDTNRVASWIVKMQPDVVMLNEVERFTSWGNENQPEVYKTLLQNKTGKTWYYTFAQEYGQWSANGKGNLILSTVPFESTNHYVLVNNLDRSIGEAVITWNGRRVTLMSTHLDPDSAALRLTQAQEVTTWAAGAEDNRILTGDMNAWPDQTSIAHFNSLYNDSWTLAAAQGTATAFPGNAGETKNGRIDYIFYSKTASALSVVSSQVYDTRDANGVMPSDHRPVLTTFAVR